MHVIPVHIVLAPREHAHVLFSICSRIRRGGRAARTRGARAPGWRTAGACSPSPAQPDVDCALRQLWRGTLLNPATPFAAGSRSFAPRPSEMVFDRNMPSCYAADGFRFDPRQHRFSHLVLGRLTGHGACLATVLDGFTAKNRITFVHDASSTRGLERSAPQNAWPTWPRLSTGYAEVVSTDGSLSN